MITAIISRHPLPRRRLVRCVAGRRALSVYALRTAPLDAIPDISDPQIVVYVKWPRSPQLLETEVTEPLISALVGIAGHPVDPRHLAHGVLVHLRHPRERRRRATRAAARARPDQRHPAAAARRTRTSRSGPNASSMGWIYQYALVDHEGTHDLRELRLLNESQIKPALQTVPGVAEVASVGGLEKQYQVKIFPPLLANAGISLRQVIARGPGRVSGGRRPDDRGHQPRLPAARRRSTTTTSTSSSTWSSAATPTATPVHLKDVGYIQVGYDQRRSTVDLDGAGEVVGGIAIMEQDQNVLAVTRALEQKLQQFAPSLPAGHRDRRRPTIARPGSGRR